MKNKIKIFNEGPKTTESLNPYYEDDEIKSGQVSQLVANFSSYRKSPTRNKQKVPTSKHGHGRYCINNSFCQIVFTKLEVPDIFRGLQCSIYCKDNSSSEEGWANGSPKENIYEEFKRYDTRHGSKKIKNPEKFADVNNKFNRNDIRQGSKKIKSPKKTADTKNKFQTQNEKFSPDSTSKIVVNKVQI